MRGFFLEKNLRFRFPKLFFRSSYDSSVKSCAPHPESGGGGEVVGKSRRSPSLSEKLHIRKKKFPRIALSELLQSQILLFTVRSSYLLQFNFTHQSPKGNAFFLIYPSR
ncbi:hypothetical protein DLM78_15725 [Leptospira stimsonii]|uniref:Uncharacterized protein n=1 Tax=Leptospira stimsonii TaxID=2202203 RepID=A0A8B3CPK2_9LEPT|nr:hypothetical protein DLM78_15725 [Leptospira stimsonii]